MKTPKGLFTIPLAIALTNTPCIAQDTPNNNDVKAIAEEAFIYSYPMIMAYGIMYEYSVDKQSSQYKGPFNQIKSEARVFTPADTAVVTPNSDTPYSFLVMDLRSEPMVLCVPAVERNRYYSVQLVSQYTFNFAYIGTRATGNKAGCYAVAGPRWKGNVPTGIKKVFRSETDFAFGIYRTQLFNPTDIENVKKIQAGYTSQPLSQFLHNEAPAPAPEVNWPTINKSMIEANPFSYLNFLLQFAPPVGTAASEKSLRARFAKIGIEAGKPFALDKLTTDEQMQIKEGMKNGLEKIQKLAVSLGKNENNWQVVISSFGSRTKSDWILSRAAIAMAGIFANDPIEAIYPMTRLSNDGEILNGSKHNYVLTFPAGKLPPVNAFWSLTMYDGKSQLLINNPINRYLINSPMLSNLKKNADGSLTLYIQKNSPGKDKESNWLPAPDGSIYMVMRLYWPKQTALQGDWEPPAVTKN